MTMGKLGTDVKVPNRFIFKWMVATDPVCKR
jgi:hypothetical protein